MNIVPSEISIDHSPGNVQDDPLDRVRGFHSAHSIGGNFAFGDGAVRFITKRIDLKTYRDISTAAGREIVSDF